MSEIASSFVTVFIGFSFLLLDFLSCCCFRCFCSSCTYIFFITEYNPGGFWTLSSGSAFILGFLSSHIGRLKFWACMPLLFCSYWLSGSYVAFCFLESSPVGASLVLTVQIINIVLVALLLFSVYCSFIFLQCLLK